MNGPALADRGSMPRHLLAVLAYAGRRETRPGTVDGTADMSDAMLARLAAAARMQ